METSSIRPPGTPEAKELVELDRRAGGPETVEQRLEREQKQNALYQEHMRKARSEQFEADNTKGTQESSSTDLPQQTGTPVEGSSTRRSSGTRK